jgi:hypothetical protein
MYLLADSERLHTRPVSIVYDWLSSVLSQTNQWLGSDLDLGADARQPFGQILARILLTS